jgi:hypothetical protein
LLSCPPAAKAMMPCCALSSSLSHSTLAHSSSSSLGDGGGVGRRSRGEAEDAGELQLQVPARGRVACWPALLGVPCAQAPPQPCRAPPTCCWSPRRSAPAAGSQTPGRCWRPARPWCRGRPGSPSPACPAPGGRAAAAPPGWRCPS